MLICSSPVSVSNYSFMGNILKRKVREGMFVKLPLLIWNHCTVTAALVALSHTNWPRGYKTFFMLNSTEHKIFLLINVKMQTTTVGILTFLRGKNSILCLSEPKKLNFLIFLYF